jgi:hypothetical protein
MAQISGADQDAIQHWLQIHPHGRPHFSMRKQMAVYVLIPHGVRNVGIKS